MRRSDRKPPLLARMMAPSFRQMQVLQLISGLGLIYAIGWSHTGPLWWCLALVSYFLTGCLGLSVTMHRAITHRSLELPRPLEVVFCLFGALGGSGSPIAWTAMHRAHHANVDTHRDPHSPEKLGWRLIFSVYDYKFSPRHVKDLMSDRFHVFIHRYYTAILLVWGAGLSVINPRLCVFVFLVPAFVQITVSNMASLLAHGQGERRYATADLSTNNVLISALGWGEGWHNNHHEAPLDWNFSRRWWEVDPGALSIAVLISLGLARDVRTSAREP
jgi:fatty-acid desaturase